jgi:AcrR family transcriptional regulator
VPAPARTSIDAIVAAGLSIVERDGLPALTMERVARAVGVKAPSLYKHVGSRGDLVRLVGIRLVTDLKWTLEAVASSGDPATDLRSMARVMRAFAHRQPGGYRLLFAQLPDEWRPSADLLAEASAPVVRAAAQLAGEDRALAGARTVTAWAHGFIDMELSGAFRLGGDVDAAYEFGIETISRALARPL